MHMCTNDYDAVNYMCVIVALIETKQSGHARVKQLHLWYYTPTRISVVLCWQGYES